MALLALALAELNEIFGNFFRLVEDDAFMQYDLRNGNSVALAEFPPELVTNICLKPCLEELLG